MDALESILSHQSVRKYLPEPISAEQMHKIEDAIIQTSSSCFFQVVTTIEVTDKEKLQKIAEYSGNQKHIAECSHFLMFCMDANKLKHIGGLSEPYNFKMLFLGINDCSLACQNALTAAESMGLGGVIIGGYKANMQGVCDLLKLPRGVVPLLGLCLGRVDKEYLEEQKPRLPRNWLIMKEEYADPINDDELKAYDELMRKYYENRKYNVRSETWSQSCLSMLSSASSKASAEIIECLEKQGYKLF